MKPTETFLKGLELLPPSLREKALRGLQEAQPEEPPAPVAEPKVEEAPREDQETLARARLQAQARLFARNRAERERPTREGVEALKAEAYALLAEERPLLAYATFQRAQALAKGLPEAAFTDPLTVEAFLEALASSLGLSLQGYDRQVAYTLLQLALEVGLYRGYHPLTSEVVFHLPQTAIAQALWPEAKPETGRKRLQRALGRLEEAGLIASAPRVGNARDWETGEPLGWKDGTVFRVRLRRGRARPLTREEIAHPWRDLQRDIKSRRTVVSQSYTPPKGVVSPVNQLKAWALPPVAKLETPLSQDWDSPPQDPRARARNAVQDVKFCARKDRREFVGRAGETLARAFRDPKSVNLYRALLWGALRQLDRGVDLFEPLWKVLERVLVDLQEGFAKKPGALLIARLRQAGLWAELMEGPMYRVA